MFCKWCGMESATTDRCSWCGGVLTQEAKPETETDSVENAAPPEAVSGAEFQNAADVIAAPLETKAEAKPAKRVPAPPAPAGNRLRSPAPPIPSRSLRTESAAPAEAEAVEEPTVGLAAGNFAPPRPASDPTVQMSAAPITAPAEPAESEEEFGGLAAGQAKPVEKAAIPTPEQQQFSANAGAPMSKYYPGKTVEETTGIGANDFPPPPVQEEKPRKPARKKTEPDLEIEWDKPELSSAAVWGRFAAAFAGVLVFAAALSLAMKPNILLPLILANFAGGMLLPILRVGPWQDEESDDSIFLFALTLIFGPFVSLAIYGVISAVKQMTNPSVLGILIVAAVTRFALGAAVGAFSLSSMTPLQSGHFDIVTLLLQWGGLVGMGGWVFANFFHKLHE